MAGKDRPNYYVLLGIGTEISWDQAAFERTLAAKRNEWSRKRLNGVKTSKATMEAQRALELLDDIVAVMLDSSLRELERSAAREQRAKQQNDRFADFQGVLRIIAIKGFVWDTEAAKLRENYAGLDGVEEQLARIPVRALMEENAVPERLEHSKAATIRSLLESIDQKSLYTLLLTIDPGLGQSPALGALQAAAKKLYQQTQQTMNKQQAGLAATHDLAGHAMDVFSNEASRKRYDNTLDLAPLDELVRTYQSALAALKRIEPGQVEQFLSDAEQAGANVSVARALLVKHFTELKWTVMLPAGQSGAALENMLRCGACKAISDADADFCVQCGARFRATCPSCGNIGPGHGSCGRCGFPVGNQDWVRVLLEDCEQLLGRNDLDGAKHKLDEAGKAWPLALDRTDELRQWQSRCTERYEELRRKREESAREVSLRLLGLMESRHYMAAYRLAVSLSTPFPDQERIRKEAGDHIREADRLFELAQRPGTSVERQTEFYQQAMTECTDHEKSQQALRRLPPNPPRDLRVVVTEGHVQLSWQPSSTEDVRYVVVRKRGVPPSSSMDGTRIGTVAALNHADRSPETGVPMHYAVFTDRGGTVSPQGAATTKTTFLTEEVTITSRAVDDGMVMLEWTLPPHAYGVTVSRTASGGGTEHFTAEPNMLQDKRLTNGMSYTYLLRAQYLGESGVIIRSQGISVALTPGLPPTTPAAMHVRTVDQSLGISYRHVEIWSEQVERSTVSVLWSQQQPGVRAGDTIDSNELAQHGSLRSGVETRSVALFNSGLYYFVSVVIMHGLAYIGGVRRYAAVPEVSALTTASQGNTVRLRWTWPASCEAVLLGYDYTGWPADPTVASYQHIVERADYERGGYYDVQVTRAEVFCVVAAIVRRGNEVFVSSGVRCQNTRTSGTRIRVDYKITLSRRQNRIQLRTSVPVTLPGLVVVGNPRHLPTDRHDGTILHEQGTVTIKQTHAFVVPSQGKHLFARVFLLGDADVDLVGPAAEQSRLR